jgi:hypothetical protein
MSRLAFIRILWQQANEQSRQPGPLASVSVLTFHDAIELFVVLAAEHMGAGPVKPQGGVLKYWEHLLKPTKSRRGGIKLSGQIAIARLNGRRNDLKHAGGIPSSEQVGDARTSAASFFEENTPTVFGIDFTAIDMADVVPQEDTRAKLKAAAAAEAAGDRKKAMALLAEGFDVLFYETVRPGIFSDGPYGFGRILRPDPMFKSSIGARSTTRSELP